MSVENLKCRLPQSGGRQECRKLCSRRMQNEKILKIRIAAEWREIGMQQTLFLQEAGKEDFEKLGCHKVEGSRNAANFVSARLRRMK